MINVESKVSLLEEQLKKWEIPGASLTIVKDGEVLYAGGAGSRDEKGTPVDGKTLFQIASCSKAFTATLAGVLATEGVLDFDIPVSQYMPDFRLNDSFATDMLTVRDFLSHRSGLPRHEYAWYGSDFTKEELFSNLKYLPLNQQIRYAYQYSNFNYFIVGCLIERLTGLEFEEALEEKLLKPLGMNGTHVYADEYESTGNFAHVYDHEGSYTMHGLREIDYYNTTKTDPETGKKIGDATGAAGCIISNAEDMAKWIQFNLDNGKVGGKQLVREDLMELIRSSHFRTGENPLFPEETLNCYGLGWDICSFRGHKFMNHGGNLNGVTSIVAFVPDRNLGVFCSVNMNVGIITEAVARDIIDSDLGIEDGNWYDRYYDYNAQMFASVADFFRAFGGTPIEGTKPSHPLSEYAGVYEVKGYRPMNVTVGEDGSMKIHFNCWTAGLKHHHYDSFATTEAFGEFPAGVIFSFAEDPMGKIRTLSVMLGTESNLKPICFVKQEN